MTRYLQLRLAKPLVFVSSLMLLGAVTLRPASNSHAKMFRFFAAQSSAADGSIITGSMAKLTTGESAVWIRVNTTQLPPGAYTNWWVIFNNPAACTEPCGLDDLFNLTHPNQRVETQASVVFGTGGIVGPNGVGHFQAHLEEGVLPLGPGQVAFGPGLLNAQGAEIHYLLRLHGPAHLDPTILQKQMNHIVGGCVNPAPSPGQPGNDPVPDHRLFLCYDPQAAVFVP